MDVVAEGIETLKQLAQMKALQCDYGQGFFFAQPLTLKEATAMIAETPDTPHHHCYLAS
jgi:EAL domain-containing protein (putative c-di-GMP-specific phosphodiesterase class I)